MPPKKRARRAARAPPLDKSPRSSPDEKNHVEADASESASSESISTPSLTDSRDPILPDEEGTDSKNPKPETATAEELSPANDETAGKGKPTYGSSGYNALKSFKGQVYSGMAIGGSHTWNYDEGTWKETKEKPDLWNVDYQTTKRRSRKAPKGTGAPVGTEYHWLIVAHQHVTKLDANTYRTHLEGSKYKLAHKPASSKAWSVPTVKGQREREVEILEDAKRRVEGLPPVLASQKVKAKEEEKGQQKVDALFSRARKRGAADTREE